jgi:hypothetical protein
MWYVPFLFGADRNGSIRECTLAREKSFRRVHGRISFMFALAPDGSVSACRDRGANEILGSKPDR